MPLKLVTGPAREPIHLAEAKLHLKIDETLDDQGIRDRISAARQHAENSWAAGWQLVTATYDLQFDCFPHYSYAIELPWPPLQSVVSITYIDTAGVTQTLDPSKYIVDAPTDWPGRIAIAYGQSWPSTRQIINAVTIRFIAGFATPFIADATTNTFAALGRIFTNNDVVRLSNSGGILPTPLIIDTDYHVISASGAAFQLSLTQGGAAIDITNIGSGTHFLGNVPREILQGILIDTTDFEENREATVIGTTRNTIPVLDRLGLNWRMKVAKF
jgi:uncharacterized phiE125 gp8 family phage protein